MQITESNNVRIVRTPDEFVVGMTVQPDGNPIKVEVIYRGQKVKEEWFNPCVPMRDSLHHHGRSWDATKCQIRVLAHDGQTLLCEAPAPINETPTYPYMVPQGPQVHITESDVSSPPALHITDEVGAVWTLGALTAREHESPKGEFAFAVFRNGVDMHEIASRIERKSGKIRCFTRQGWRVWNGSFFF